LPARGEQEDPKGIDNSKSTRTREDIPYRCFAISFAKEKNKERRRESRDLQPNQTNHEGEDRVRQGTMKESCPFCDWLFSIYRRAWWPGWLLGFDLPPLEESSVTVMQRQVRVHPVIFFLARALAWPPLSLSGYQKKET